MRLDLATVLAGTDAEVYRVAESGSLQRGQLSAADLERPFTGVGIDSRTIQLDALFVALQGERVDGHEFVAAALQGGALGALVARVPEGPLPVGRYLLVVSDPLRALQELAHYWRRQHSVEVVGVTGSIGKTTTKEIMAGLLGAAVPVLKSEANLNTEIGLPLVLLELREEHRLAVLEMGMYLPGDIALLARIAEPRIGVVTNVAPIHLERIGSIERIARGKSELVAALPPDGIAILNADDPWTRAMAVTSGVARPVLVGQAEDAAYRAIDVISHGLEGVSFTLQADGRSLRLRTGVPGVHTIGAFLAGIAVAREIGVPWEAIERAVEDVRLEERQRIIRHRDGVLIIDDSYNAAPMSVDAALSLLDASPGTKIAVLGDMLELGPVEEASHRQVGERVAAVADWLILRGPRSRWIAEEAEQHGLSLEQVIRVEDNAQAVDAVREIVGPSQGKWAILVKGSRGMAMEEVVQGLRGAL